MGLIIGFLVIVLCTFFGMNDLSLEHKFVLRHTVIKTTDVNLIKGKVTLHFEVLCQ